MIWAGGVGGVMSNLPPSQSGATMKITILAATALAATLAMAAPALA